jgi:hypothetical protein
MRQRGARPRWRPLRQRGARPRWRPLRQRGARPLWRPLRWRSGCCWRSFWMRSGCCWRRSFRRRADAALAAAVLAARRADARQIGCDAGVRRGCDAAARFLWRPLRWRGARPFCRPLRRHAAALPFWRPLRRRGGARPGLWRHAGTSGSRPPRIPCRRCREEGHRLRLRSARQQRRSRQRRPRAPRAHPCRRVRSIPHDRHAPPELRRAPDCTAEEAACHDVSAAPCTWVGFGPPLGAIRCGDVPEGVHVRCR